MNKTIKIITFSLVLISLSGCASLSWMKFWGDDEEEIELPAVLNEFTQKIVINSLWNAKVGKEKIRGRISPSISGERVFYVNAEGELFAFNKNNGRKLWEKETDDQASGGLETAFRKIIYGTLDGEVVVLNQENGEETWRSLATSEILSSPVTNGSVVVAQGADGSVASVPVLILSKKNPEASISSTLVATPVEPGGTSTVYGAGFVDGERVSLVSGGKILAGGEANSDGAFTIDVKVGLDIGLYTISAVGSSNSEATAPLLVASKE